MRDILRCRTAALGGASGSLYGLWPRAAGIPLLPQPPLSEVPGIGSSALGRGADGTCAAGSVLPPRLHASRPAQTARPTAHPREIYDLLFRSAADTLLTLGRTPRHLGAELGITAVLHTWNRQLEHNPHVHCIVTAGGLSPDGARWIASRPNFHWRDMVEVRHARAPPRAVQPERRIRGSRGSWCPAVYYERRAFGSCLAAWRVRISAGYC
jgi:hypothetical protein